jgi:hypothetical protein
MIDCMNVMMDAKIDCLNDLLHVKIDSLNCKLDDKIDGLNGKIDSKIDALKDSLASAKVWALVLYIALAGSIFATLARGFGWI